MFAYVTFLTLLGTCLISQLADYLGRRLIVELEETEKLNVEFKAKTEATDADLIAEWSKDIGKAPWKVGEEWHSIFRQKGDKGKSA